MMTLLQQGQVLLLFLCVAMQGDHGAEGHAAGRSLIICSDNDIIVIHNPVSVGQSSTELHPTCVWSGWVGNGGGKSNKCFWKIACLVLHSSVCKY